MEQSSSVPSGLGTSAGVAIWQSEWIDAVWGQLISGTYSGIDNVVVDGSIAQTEGQLQADLNTIDNMLLGNQEASDLLSEVQSFAQTHPFRPGIDPLTGSLPTARATQSLAKVLQQAYEQGLLPAETSQPQVTELAVSPAMSTATAALTAPAVVQSASLAAPAMAQMATTEADAAAAACLLPFTIIAEGQISINGNSDFDGDPLRPEDDALIYGGRGFTLNGQAVLPVQRDASGNPILDAQGRPIVVQNALAVSASYSTINAPSNLYGGLVPPQIVDTQTVTVPSHTALVDDTLAQRIPAGTVPIVFNRQSKPLNNASDWQKNFPPGGTATQPSVIRITGGGLNIPGGVTLANTVLLVDSGDINFNGSGHQLNNVTLVTYSGGMNLANIVATDSAILSSRQLNMNGGARFSGQSLLAGQNSVTFSGATTSGTDRLRVVSQKDITFNSSLTSRAQLLAGGNVSFNNPATLYGRIRAKGNIIFNQPTTVFAANDALIVGANRTVVVAEDSGATALTIELPKDRDGDALTLRVSGLPEGSQGAVRLAGGGAVAVGQLLTPAELQGLVFVPVADANGAAGSFSYVADDGWCQPAAQTVTLQITPVNDGPVVTAPGALTLDAGTSLSFAASLQIQDIDAGELPLQVTLAVGHGQLQIGDAAASSSLVLTGSVSELNAQLAQLLYRPTAGYAGADALTIAVSDQGNTGAGGALTDSATVELTVTPVVVEPLTVTLGLVSDTGSDGSDGITSVATITGSVSDASRVARLSAGFGETPAAEYVDISSYLQAGSFTLDAAALATVLGQPLTDGVYTLYVVAEDSLGNVFEPVSYHYTLDSSGPVLSVTELRTSNTDDGLIHLVGSVDEAVTVSVALNNGVPTTFTLGAAGSFDQVLQALPVEPGEYTLALMLTDAAGNVTQQTLGFEVAAPPVPGTNLPPVFEPIAPLTVMPGQKIEIPLVATDPEGRWVTYTFRSEGPLPKGRLDGAGSLVFEPTPDQVGTYEFTLVATDGETETTQQVSLTVVPDPDTTTRLSGQVLDTQGNPLANLPLALGRLQVVTDADGNFTVTIPPTSFPTEEINIQIPLGDAAFDPFFTGTREINLRRTTFDGATGTSLSNPLRHPNLVSTFLDANMVYGSDAARAAALRTNDGTGRLKVSDGDLLPINNRTFFPDGTLTNDNRGLTDPATLFATGDVRANENIALTAVHTVFVREHNRLADELKVANPELSDEAIYQRARKLVAAQIQHITYSEYLPLLIGDYTIADYAGYDAAVDPSISHLFSAAAFRMGHTQSFEEFLLIGDDGQALPSVSLNQSTFNPAIVQQYGVDAILRGLFAQSSEAIDTKVLSELRNTLFGPPGSGGIDLAAVDIQRGRDVGLPDYNQARIDFGLAPVTSFAEITSDVTVQAALAQVYGTVDDIDAIVGGLAEDAVSGSMVGEFFQTVIADQFARLRDGDRFWYENGQFTAEELGFIRSTSLSALLARNTGMTGLADNLFSTGRNPAALAQGGTAAGQSVSEYASLDGSNNNLANPELGKVGTRLRVDYTQEYGDGIRTLAGAERANVREISNAVFTQDESVPDPTGATGFMLAWSQFLGHDMTLSPAGAADTLKVYGTQYVSATGEVFPFIAERLNLLLGHEVYAGVNNVIDRPIFLPALDIANNTTTVDSSGDITVTNGALGAQVFVKANSLKTNQGLPFNGELTISEVPPHLTPAALPKTLLPDLVVTIQPGEMVFETPARLTLPNRAGWTPGQTLDLWSISPITGDFEIVGVGRISANGQSVETIDGGIRNSSWHMFVPTPPLPLAQAPKAPECHQPDFTSTVNLETGAVIETHNLVSYQSFGETRGVQLRYDSLRADTRPIIETHFSPSTLQTDSYILAKVNINTGNLTYQLPGAAAGQYGLQGGEHIWKIPVNAGGGLQTALQVDLRSQATGLYGYEMTSGVYQINDDDPSNPMFTGSSWIWDQMLVHVNKIESHFGSGWGIAGLQEIVEDANGSVLLIDGDGTEVVFEKSIFDSSRYQSPTGDFSVLEKLSDGTFQRTMREKTIYRFNENNDLASVTDRNNNATRYEYDNRKLMKIVDPAGLETVFTYNEREKVSSITDPAGRQTQFNYDTAGNLVKIVDPDATQRQFQYDTLHRMVGEIDKNGHQEKAIYDFAGRAARAVQKDGTTIVVNPLVTQGLYRPEETINPNNIPLAKKTVQNVESYIDGNGHATTTQTSNNGQVLSSSEDRRIFTRDSSNLVTRSNDRAGNVTFYEYDQNGNLTKVTDSLSGPGDTETGGYTSGDRPQDMTVVDLNRDGFDDIVTVESEKAVIFFSNGDRTFSDPVEHILPGYFNPKLVVGDVNSDGYADIIAIRSYEQMTSFLGNGAGDFTRVTRSGAFRGTHLLDIDSDGRLDLLDLESYDGDWFRGNGDGSFRENSSRFTDRLSWELKTAGLDALNPSYLNAVGDFDGDGDLDVISLDDDSDFNAPNKKLRVLTNTGNGNWWTSPAEVLPVSLASSVVSSDLDGDQDLDLVLYGTDSGFEALINNGNGVFSVAANVDLYVNATEPEDGNGEAYFVTATQTGNRLFFGSSNSGFEPYLQVDLSNYRESGLGEDALFDDIDGDGDIDIVVAEGGGYGSETLMVIENRGRGNWQTSYIEPLTRGRNSNEFVSNGGIAKLGDINNDGILDLVSPFYDAIGIRLGLGNSQFSDISKVAYDGPELDRFDFLDVNRDGNLDIVSMSYAEINVLTGDGTGRFELVNQVVTEDTTWETLVLGRFDDNGVADFAGLGSKLSGSFYVPALNIGFDISTEGESALSGVSGSERGRGEKSYAYDDTFSQLVYIHDELRRQTLYELDDYGNRTAEIRVVGKIDSLTDGEKDDLITRYRYRPGGLVDEIIDPDGKVTKHDYDAYGRLTQIDYDYGAAASPVVSYVYEATNLTGQQDAIIDEEGVRTDYEYDALNRIVSMTVTKAGNVSTTTYEYDAMGNLILEADAAGVLRTTYDKKGRVVTVADKDGSTAAYEYDGNGNRTKAIRNGEVIEANEYDERDLLIASTNQAGRTTRYAYDATGNLSQSDDGRTQISYVRDARGQVIEKVFEDSAAQGIAAASFAARSFAAPAALPGQKQSEAFTHDATGKATAKLDRDGQLIEFDYDKSTYQPTAVKFTEENTEVGLTYKEFEKDEKTFHKPTKVSGEFGEITLAYTAQGKFKGSSNDALMDVFAAALGAKSRSELVDMLSYDGKDIPEPDPCLNMKGEETPEEDKTPPDEVMDAWARLRALSELFALVSESLSTDYKFLDFLKELSSEALTDITVTRLLGSLSEDVLTNENFTSAIPGVEVRVLKAEKFRDAVADSDNDFLKSEGFSLYLSNAQFEFDSNGVLVSSIISPDQVLRIVREGSSTALLNLGDTLAQKLGYSDLHAFAWTKLNETVVSNYLDVINPDVPRIVDLYFTHLDPIERIEISSGGFEDNYTTDNGVTVLNDYIQQRISSLSSSELKGISTLSQLVELLSIPSEYLNVSGQENDNAPESELDEFLREVWKYEGAHTVGGFIAGGVGRGGNPPSDAELLVDYRLIDPLSPVTVTSLSDRDVNFIVAIDYLVTVGDVFDFDPGGGGYEELSDPFTLVTLEWGDLRVMGGILILRTLESNEKTQDVPFETETFVISKSVFKA